MPSRRAIRTLTRTSLPRRHPCLRQGGAGGSSYRKLCAGRARCRVRSAKKFSSIVELKAVDFDPGFAERLNVHFDTRQSSAAT
jgi:hypothetical protein